MKTTRTKKNRKITQVDGKFHRVQSFSMTKNNLNLETTCFMSMGTERDWSYLILFEKISNN